jgi:NAD(P)H-flavin reductase
MTASNSTSAASRAGGYTMHVFERMRPGDRVRFEGPAGSFFLREDSEKPMIFVAGSTGFAPVKACWSTPSAAV